MEHEFKAGDRVVCTDAADFGKLPLLVIGKEYIVEFSDYSFESFVSLKGVDGMYFPHRFQLAEKPFQQVYEEGILKTLVDKQLASHM